MSQQTEQLINQDQLSLLRQLAQFQPSLQFHSLTQIPIPNNIELQAKNSQRKLQTPHKEQAEHKLSQSVGSQAFSSSLLSKRRHSSIRIKFKPQPQSSYQPNSNFLFIEKQLQKEGASKYNQLKKKLFTYKEKSDQIYKVSEFIKAYEENFMSLVKQKDELVGLLNSIKGETTLLVEKQKKLIDLSMAIKESLDYYSYHQKSQFNYACEISSRQLFEDNLQSTLSTIMDAIEFFQQNQTFVQSRKHLNFYLSSKSKIISFIKSFYIKLFNKENAFIMKHLNANKIDLQMGVLYPKSKLKLLSDFLLTFPHVKKHLRDILVSVKEQNMDSEEKEKELKFLEMREMEIDEFLLSESNVSLIRYLEKNNFELYSEVMLNLFTFNRFNFHQNFIFSWARRIGVESPSLNPTEPSKETQKQRLKQFKSKLHFVIQTIISEYIYFQLCCHPTNPQSIEFITSWFYKLVFKYLEILVKESREFVVRWKFNPFELCEQISNVVDKELGGYFENLGKEQYQSFVMGRLWQEVLGRSGVVINSNSSQKGEENFHSKFLKQLFKNSLKTKILAQIGQFCYQSLPKLQLTQKRQQVQENINKLIYFIPKLQYCPKNAETYMISSLDVLIKSIKQINQRIESRFECYSWNLIIFGVIRTILFQTKQFPMVSKEIRLDFNESLNLIDRVKQLQRPESLIKYAQDIFNVIKTGMPSLNELTLDFNKYVNEHYEELESRFLKDILFIYAKNMVEFLQKTMDGKKRINSQKEINSHKQLHVDQNENTLETTRKSSITQDHATSPHHSTSPTQHNLTQDSLQQRSPKGEQKPHKPTNEMQKMCEPLAMKSLYNSYILSIEKYIRESREMLTSVEQSKIERKEQEISNLKNLIREVYEKLFDFLDSFYVTVSEWNSEVTAEFEEIAKIKEKQEALWLGPSISENKKVTQEAPVK